MSIVKLEATLPSAALSAVKEAIEELGCLGLTVSELQGGPAGGSQVVYRGSVGSALRPLARVEIVIARRRQEEALDAIARAAEDAGYSDVEILVLPVHTAVRIRTGETGEDALGG